jgi:hypothetical protein
MALLFFVSVNVSVSHKIKQFCWVNCAARALFARAYLLRCFLSSSTDIDDDNDKSTERASRSLVLLNCFLYFYARSHADGRHAYGRHAYGRHAYGHHAHDRHASGSTRMFGAFRPCP